MSNELSVSKLDEFFRSFLDIEGFANDAALNGIQVDNDGSPVKKIAFGVDAAMETFEQAAALGAGMLFVHHGLFWGKQVRIAGNLKQRINFLLDHNICLYAVHLPLDQHSKFGNNAVIAQLLELENIEPFGVYAGRKIGYKGIFSKPVAIDEAVKKISFMGRPPAGIFPFGKKECANAAVVSGGAASNVRDAMEEGIDLFITGECDHSVYHDCLESKLNMIAGGHYSTEVWGVQAVMRHCIEELGIDAQFIDIPTGL
ncbi:MAG: Nif3-like dinuclear metal center hexameric protein [Treponema sp.]|nr:Nif3-like dinuclear metal center hexameric protein [Treponema sp.]MCL2250851.1 Nif3-like dinuclear metal center hexameric protein [Treponema sp.]